MRDEMGQWPDMIDGENPEQTGDTASEASDDAQGSGDQMQGDPVQADPVQADPVQAPLAHAPGHAPPMRTLLKQFSEEFTDDVEPLIGPVQGVADTLGAASPDLCIQAVLPDLRDLLHHVRALTEKVAEQQAYVLIFGPLKSGKSTFMNAICSAYVSEVTSLPAYPCIVNVTHDSEPSFTVTRYDGRSETYTEQGDVYDVVQQAHSDLMATIRRIEDDGDDFDPAIHMPQAIRTIDVHLPTGDLSESGAVLVDTPGLYSRMKFGYDRLTRDFRNAAACAIFIVKTDNLFLEQVFDEFHELLDLFSRVFLIVNLDTTKQDLDPSGLLVPSLEHDDPGRIIDAFTDLSMSAPLKAAAEAGRLQIYPVDLLGAASARIRGVSDGDHVERAHGQDNFDVLLGDLTDYLNSSEYLRAFLNDSLRRAGSLLDDLDELTSHEVVGELSAEADALEKARQQTVARREAVARLAAVNWTEQTKALHRFLATQADQQADEVKRITGHALVGAIEAWFENDASLASLRDSEIEPLLNSCRTQFIHFLRGEMTQQLPGMRDAVSVTDGILDDAAALEIDLGALARRAMEDTSPGATLVPVKSNLGGEQIPVRRGFWDWLLMRSKTSVRRRLFGPAGDPSRRIPAAMKSKRLADAGRAAMEDMTAEQFEVLLKDATTHLPEELVTSYVANLTGPLTQAVTAKDEQTAAKLAEIETRLAEIQRILAEFELLAGHVERTVAAVNVLKERFDFEDIDPDAASEPAGALDEPADEPADAVEADQGNDDDDFDDIYAPYLAAASALPDRMAGLAEDDEDDQGEEDEPTPNADAEPAEELPLDAAEPVVEDTAEPIDDSTPGAADASFDVDQADADDPLAEDAGEEAPDDDAEELPLEFDVDQADADDPLAEDAGEEAPDDDAEELPLDAAEPVTEDAGADVPADEDSTTEQAPADAEAPTDDQDVDAPASEPQWHATAPDPADEFDTVIDVESTEGESDPTDDDLDDVAPL